MSGARTERAEVVLEAILEEVRAGKIRLYHSFGQQFNAYISINENNNNYCLMLDWAVKHWIADFAWSRGLGLLHTRELNRILNILAGRAMATPIAKIEGPDLLHVLEPVPIMDVVVEYMFEQTTRRHEHPTKEFWEKLQEFAKKRGLLQLGRRRFPGGPNVFSRALKHYAPVLAQLGITVEIRRSNGSKTVLERSDDSHSEPSAISSDANSLQQPGLTPEDDRERRRALLEARRARNDSHSNQGDLSP